MKAQVAHGLVVGLAFIPYFLIESFGFSLPLIGLAELDTSYEYNSIIKFFMMMLTLLLGVVAYTEYSMQMSSKTFCYYHYPLCLVILIWFTSPTCTLLGKLFFSLPFLFTLWSTLETFAPKSLPSALL